MTLSYYCTNGAAQNVFEMLTRLQILLLSATINKVRLFQYYLTVIVITEVVFVGYGVRLPEV